MIAALVKKHKVLICVGSGGVGKTTVSASLGIAAARQGLKVLVMTIDPSRRLKVALGLDENQDGPTRVPNQQYSGEIWATLLDPQKIFRDFILGASADPKMSERLMRNRLYQQLSTTLSGSQEFTSLLQLTRIVTDKNYDLVILDTPPAQHAVDFLEAPEKINSLFQESVVRWFIGDEEEIGFVRKIIARGTKTVLGALERITGSHFMSELSDFFLSVRAVQGKISQKTNLVREILQSDNTGFLLVTGFDSAKLVESQTLKRYLSGQGYHLLGTIINRAFPDWPMDARIADPGLAQIYERWRHFHQERQAVYERFRVEWSKNLPVLTIPDLNRDLSGLDSLEVMADEIVNAANRGDRVVVAERN